MKIEYKFRHVPHSADLERHVADHIEKIERFELKPTRVEFTFSAEKKTKRVDIHLRLEHLDLHAHGEAADFFAGIDLALEKMARQLARKKARVKAHKKVS